MASIIDRLQVILGIKTEGFQGVRSSVKSLTEGIQKDVSQLKNAVAGYFSVEFAKELYGHLKSTALEIKQLSRATGLGVEDVQKYQKAWGKVGLDVMDASKAFDQLIDKRRKALFAGGDKDAEFFRGFGISEEELKGMEAGNEIAERLAKTANDPSNPKQRESFLEEFGVKKGGQMLAGFAQMSKQKDFEKFSEHDIDAFVEASRTMKEATHHFEIAAMPLATALTNFVAHVAKGLFDGEENPSRDRQDSIREIAHELRGTLGVNLYSKEEKERINRIFDESRGRGQMSYKAMTLAERQLKEIQTGKKFGLTGDQKVRNFASAHGIPWNDTNEEFDAKVEAFAKAKGLPWVGKKEQETGAKNTNAIAFYKSAQQDAIKEHLNKAMFDLVFKDGTHTQKKDALTKRLSEVNDEQKNEKDPVEKSKLEAQKIGLAGQLAMMDHNQYKPEQQDQLASHGLYVGGAAAMNDPKLQIQQDILEAVKEILTKAGSDSAPINALSR